MRWPILVRRVKGQSMSPALHQNQIIIATGWFISLKPNDIVIISHDGIEKIKRIQKNANNQIFLIGDNPKQSTDSRQFGGVPRSDVIAKKF